MVATLKQPSKLKPNFMANEKEKVAKPQTEPSTDTTVVTNGTGSAPMSDADKIALADKKIEEDRIAELKKTSATKIADLNSAIAKADSRKAKYEGDDEDTVATREFMISSRPLVWENIQNDPIDLRKELADYKLSLLTPEQKAFAGRWSDAQAKLDAAQKEQTDLRTEILASYPDFFGTTAKAKSTTAKTAGATAKTDEVVEFTGTMLDKPTAKARVLALVAQGVTGETDIIKAIYGDNFTINNSKPRFQVHSIRVEEGLVSKKA